MTEIKAKMDEAIELLKEEYKNNFWEGKIKMRKANLQELHSDLSNIFNNQVELDTDNISHYYKDWKSSGESHFNPQTNKIVLRGRISLITYLHEFAHALGFKKQSEAQKFAIYIFERAYPDKFAKLTPIHNGEMFINPNARQSGQVDTPLNLPETMFDMSNAYQRQTANTKFPLIEPQPIDRPEIEGDE